MTWLAHMPGFDLAWTGLQASLAPLSVRLLAYEPQGVLGRLTAHADNVTLADFVMGGVRTTVTVVFLDTSQGHDTLQATMHLQQEPFAVQGLQGDVHLRAQVAVTSLAHLLPSIGLNLIQNPGLQGFLRWSQMQGPQGFETGRGEMRVQAQAETAHLGSGETEVQLRDEAFRQRRPGNTTITPVTMTVRGACQPCRLYKPCNSLAVT